MKKRWIAALLACLFTLCLLTGCGGTASSAGGDAAVDDNMSNEASAEVGWDTPPNGSTDTGGGTPAALRRAKVIYSGYMYAQTQEFDASVRAITETAEALGGYLESTSVSGEIGYRHASYTVRIPSAQFEAFQQKIGESCHVTDRHTSVQDITEAYVDTEARLATLNTKHERLLSLLEKADNMENIIALETALADTEYEIEQYAGTLRRFDSLVDFSTLELSLNEVRTLDPVSDTPAFGAALQKAFASGSMALVTFFQGLLLGFAGGWPFWIILIVIAAAVLRVLRRRRNKSRADWTTPPATPPDPPHDDPQPPENP